MKYKKRLIRLTYTPCMVNSEIKKRTVNLVQQEDQYFLEEIIHQFDSRKRRKISVSVSEVEKRINALRNVNIPAFPVSPDVLDGEYVEITIFGDFSTLSLGWWTIPPEGAEGIDEFIEWLESKIS